jgi:hypothetical protein
MGFRKENTMPAIGEILNMKYNKASKTQTLTGNNTTVATPLFRITGSVHISQLYSVITTALGSNVTATHWRSNDQTATLPISAAAGTTLSSLPAGTMLTRHSLVSVALKADTAAAAKVIDPVAATAPAVHMPFIVVQKTGGVQTDIEFVYTCNNQTSGVIQHFVEWQPLSEGATLAVI